MLRKELIETIEKAVNTELQDANKIFPLFHSGHEAYGVIKEEVDETEEQYKQVELYLESYFESVKVDATTDTKRGILSLLKNHALYTILELVQVAAMAQKAIDSREQS